MSIVTHDDLEGRPIDGPFITINARYNYPKDGKIRYEVLGAGEIKAFKNGVNAGRWLDEQVQDICQVLDQEV